MSQEVTENRYLSAIALKRMKYPYAICRYKLNLEEKIRMNKKFLFSLMAVLVIASMILTACGGGATPAPTQPPRPLLSRPRPLLNRLQRPASRPARLLTPVASTTGPSTPLPGRASRMLWPSSASRASTWRAAADRLREERQCFH